MDIINALKQRKIVAVIRAKNKKRAKEIIKECIAGGITIIEVTYTTPNASDLIEELRNSYDKEIIIGAGTVLDKDMCEEAISRGAQFIVSPGFDMASASYCLEQKIEYIPGCMTITEMMNAQKAGAKMIKLFPGSSFSPSFIKAVKGPLPEIDIMPTGGVNLDNLNEWFTNGAAAVGVGSSLTKPKSKTDTIKNIAEKYVSIIKEMD